mgnify:CR=1 FL=1
MRARKYRVASNDTVLSATRYGPYARLSRIISCRYTVVITDFSVSPYNKENTRLFFDLVDRRYNKEGAYNIVFTSNKMPSMWRENFNEDDALLCALDRIFDDAMVFRFKGESFRGRKLDTINLHTGRVKGTGLDYSDSTI